MNIVVHSVVTLTTLGYGDIVSRSEVVRGLVIMKAVAGQPSLAVMIARLVSLSPSFNRNINRENYRANMKARGQRGKGRGNIKSPFGRKAAMAVRMQVLCSVLMVTLLGCAAHELPPSSPPPQTAVKVEESPSESFTTFLGIKQPYPGDASNTYFLRSVVEKPNGQVAHQLYVANYYRSSEGWIVWSRANGEDAQPLEFVAIHRGVLSCGAGSGCALEEEFGAVIPNTMLRASPGGFSVKFYADTGQELVIHLTSQQIQQQLKAIEDFQASRQKL